MKAIGIVMLLGVSACGAPPRNADTAAIADLQRRVAALEKQAGTPSPPAKGYELLAPALGSERRLYPSEAKCDEARNQILSEVASRAATIQSATGSPGIVVPPFVSCVPA